MITTVAPSTTFPTSASFFKRIVLGGVARVVEGHVEGDGSRPLTLKREDQVGVTPARPAHRLVALDDVVGGVVDGDDTNIGRGRAWAAQGEQPVESARLFEAGCRRPIDESDPEQSGDQREEKRGPGSPEPPPRTHQNSKSALKNTRRVGIRFSWNDCS